MTVCVTNNVSLLNQLVIISHIFTYIFICYLKQMTVILEIGIFTKVKIRISSIVCGFFIVYLLAKILNKMDVVLICLHMYFSSKKT